MLLIGLMLSLTHLSLARAWSLICNLPLPFCRTVLLDLISGSVLLWILSGAARLRHLLVVGRPAWIAEWRQASRTLGNVHLTLLLPLLTHRTCDRCNDPEQDHNTDDRFHMPTSSF